MNDRSLREIIIGGCNLNLSVYVIIVTVRALCYHGVTKKVDCE